MVGSRYDALANRLSRSASYSIWRKLVSDFLASPQSKTTFQYSSDTSISDQIPVGDHEVAVNRIAKPHSLRNSDTSLQIYRNFSPSMAIRQAHITQHAAFASF